MNKFEKLKSLLNELFQLDQPDLDFGIYRIMHAKSDEVTQFLERDLLPQVKAAFAQYQSASKAEIQAELDKVTRGLRDAGIDPDTAAKVQELKRRLATEAVDIDQLEADVYDHLYQFFSRYYSDGDFISKRRYSKDGKYAIPYDGEEVKLYWANHDQYYIKTSEYLRDYAFRLKPDDDANPMRVHFRLVDVAEGEHGNVKPQNGKERVFILKATDFATIENGELVLRFEYRPATLTDWPEDQRADKTKPPAQKDLTAIAESRILATDGPDFAPWIAELSKPHVKADGSPADYTRLRAHLNRYVARNTFDYFIHKDLGGFLRRELDFYIKNEVMMLDDIENETAPRVEQYLSKIKVIRKIAGKIIAFLAQLEDFQKALWLKKKFVVETSWCVALKEIPEEFLPEIAANAAQLAEWRDLGIVGQGDLGIVGQGDGGTMGLFEDADERFVSLSPSLKVPKSCMIDTRHFPADFTARLLTALGDLDAKTDGVLFHSENFQALSLMQARYRERVKCVYIDPPYNTGNDGFSYRDSYRHSSWLAMIFDRLMASAYLQGPEGAAFISLDDNEAAAFKFVGQMAYGDDAWISTCIWQKNYSPKSSARQFSEDHDYIVVLSKGGSEWIPSPLPRTAEQDEAYKNPDNDPRGPWKPSDLSARNYYSLGTYSVTTPSGRLIDGPPTGRYWSINQAKLEELRKDNRIWWGTKGDSMPQLKRFLSEVNEGRVPQTLWHYKDVGHTQEAKQAIVDIVHFESSDGVFATPKSVRLIERVVRIGGNEADSRILDFFAGSGTTGHAVINLNREDGGRRKFILVEMADYFDTVLLPRLKKVAFTPEWKDGKPKRLPTAEEIERGPRLFKIVRLESYEDTLNNLEVKRTAAQQSLLDLPEAQGPDRLREQYLLQYLLKVETQGSPSLLNIAAFSDPTAYRLKVKRPGSDESREVCVDLIETFNWLIGLTVEHMAAPQVFSAKFERDAEKRLRLNGRLRAGSVSDGTSPFWFHTVTGTLPDGRKTLVIWRKLTGNPEEDNLVLDEWFTKQGYSSKDSEFDLIYVNGGNNLENLKTPDDTWKVRLIEEDFHRLMFSGTEGLGD
jgi:adenine-specific DNA-methyltransferase